MTQDIKGRLEELIAGPEHISRPVPIRFLKLLSAALQSSSRREAAAVGALREIKKLSPSDESFYRALDIARSALQAVEGGEGGEQEQGSSVAESAASVASQPDCSTAQHSAGLEREDQIKHMVQRFLGWRLPEDFHPDCGIQFDADGAKKLNPRNLRYEPIGTNLFDAEQATAMVRYMLEGL